MLARVTLFLFVTCALAHIAPLLAQTGSGSGDEPGVSGTTDEPVTRPEPVPEAEFTNPVPLVSEVAPEPFFSRLSRLVIPWMAGLSALFFSLALADAYLRSLKLQKKFAMLFCSNFLARWSSDHIRPGLYRCEYRLRYWPWPWVVITIFVDRQRYPEEDFSEIDFPSFRRDVYAEVQDIIDNDLACSIKPHKEVIVRGHEVLIEAHMRGGEVWEQQPAIGISLSPSERTVEQSCVN